MQAYRRISTTLESISASAATSIAPQLSHSLVVQANCKKVMEEKEKTMQRIWTDAIEAFVGDVTREVDLSLQAALISIKQEAGQMVEKNYKRQREKKDGEHSEEKMKKGNASSEAMIREDKRRRVRDSSLVGSQDDKEGPLDEISDMKLKIEQQAQMLAVLEQENNEVRDM